MRRFTLGSGSDRKIVGIELSGTRMSIVKTMSDKSTKRSEKDFASEADARSASNKMASELISRGYTESKKGGKKKKKSQSSDALDKRVLAGVAAVGIAFIGVIAFIAYDAFLKPPTIVGVWRGGLVEHEISRSLTVTEYDLVLDDQKRAALSIEVPGLGKNSLVGTYAVKGNRLKLTVKDDDGDSSDREYKIVLGRVSLELYDIESGKMLVQLIRFRENPVVRAQAPRRSKPVEPVATEGETVDDSDE